MSDLIPVPDCCMLDTEQMAALAIVLETAHGKKPSEQTARIVLQVVQGVSSNPRNRPTFLADAAKRMSWAADHVEALALVQRGLQRLRDASSTQPSPLVLR